MGVAGGGAGGGGPNKPKLIRQSAILADGDSTSSGKSVTFKDVPEENPSTSSKTGLAMPSAQQRRLIAATTELGQCPLHTAVQLRQVYGKLAELSNEAAAAGGGVHSVGKGVPEEDEEVEEESDMSDSEADDEPVAEDPASDGMPLGTTFRNLQQPHRNSSSWIPRKLSQISHGGTSGAASNKTKVKGQGGRVTHASSDNRPSGAEEEGEEADETTPLRSDCQTAAQVLGGVSAMPVEGASGSLATQSEGHGNEAATKAELEMQVSGESKDEAQKPSSSLQSGGDGGGGAKKTVIEEEGGGEEVTTESSQQTLSSSAIAAELAKERKSQTQQLKKRFLESEM